MKPVLPSLPALQNPAVRRESLSTGSKDGALEVVRVGEAAAVVGGRAAGGPAAERPTLAHPGSWLGGMVRRCRVLRSRWQRALAWQDGTVGSLCCASCSKREPEGLDQNWVSCLLAA